MDTTVRIDRDETELTRTQRDVIQAVYEDPGRLPAFYADKVSKPENTVKQCLYGTAFEREAHEKDARKVVYRLTDAARRHFNRLDVIDTDPVAEMENRSEEPTQRHERGNVTTVGEIDMTDSRGEQPISEAPYWNDDADEAATDGVDAATDDEVSDAVEDVEADVADPKTLIAVGLTPGDAFEIIRGAPRSTARRVFEQLVDDVE